jgi:CheY-like chemotaxis protein
MARILIVDDDVDSAESTAILLRLEGHEVLMLTESHAVVTAVAAFRPDLAILDVGLPGIDGYELARRLRQAGCSARLVALTGYGRAEDIRRAREAGFDDHYLKPIEPKLLGDLLT